jgi:hypothetical protein
MKAYRVKGTTDEVTTCDLCGKQELKGTVVLEALDADENEEAICYFGVSCAAKAAGWTQREVKAGVKVAKDEERERQRAERDAKWAAEREFLAGWYLEHCGTSDLREAADRAGVSTVRLSGEAIHAYRELQRAAEAAPAVDETPEVATTSAPVANFRETALTVAGVERVVRTELGGKLRTVKQLEAAHTKSVKETIIKMRVDAAPDTMPHEMAERLAKRATQFPACNWDAARRPLRPVTTEDPATYLVEIAPGHYATHDAAELLDVA